MAVTFAKDANTLTFPTDQNREYPLDDAIAAKGVLQRTKQSTIVYDARTTDNPRQIPLTLKYIDQAFFDNLKDWFNTKVQGRLYKFNYTNPVTGESALAVRWVNGFDFTDDGLYYSGNIVLEKEL